MTRKLILSICVTVAITLLALLFLFSMSIRREFQRQMESDAAFRLRTIEQNILNYCQRLRRNELPKSLDNLIDELVADGVKESEVDQALSDRDGVRVRYVRLSPRLAVLYLQNSRSENVIHVARMVGWRGAKD